MQLHCSSLSSILLSGGKQVKLQAGSSFINIEITRAGTLLSAVLCNSLIYNPDHCSHMPRNLKTEAKTVYPRCPVKKKCQDTCFIKYAWSSTAPAHNIPASKFTPLHTELCSCSPLAALCSTWVRLRSNLIIPTLLYGSHRRGGDKWEHDVPSAGVRWSSAPGTLPMRSQVESSVCLILLKKLCCSCSSYLGCHI